jgi:hypothetical protein
MNGGTRIIAFGSNGEQPEHEDTLLAGPLPQGAPQDWAADEPDSEQAAAPSPRNGWWPAALAAVAAAAWTGLFLWAREAQIAAFSPAQLTGLIADWAGPVMLIGVVWLLVMRNSRREAARFGDAAQRLSEESLRLETRLSAVNRELSLAREFIAAQSRDLEGIGRVAAERLSQNADRLQDLIRENGSRVEAIGTVSQAALENMERLRSQLPVIASSAKDVTNNIGNAGRTALSQLQDMANGFGRLNDFGQASERQVQKLRALVDETIAEFTRQADLLGTIADTRFTALAERGAEFRTQLETHEVEALAAIRTRAAAMAGELDETRQRLDGHEAESLTSLRARLAALRDEGTQVSRALRDGEERALEAWEATAAHLRSGLRERLRELVEEIGAAGLRLSGQEAEGFAALQARILALRDEGASVSQALREGESEALAGWRASAERTEAEIRARAAAMAGHFAELQQKLDAHEAESLTSLRARTAALRDEGAAISRALRDGEGRALEGWQDAVTRMEATLRTALAAIDEADAGARQAAQARIEALAGDVERLEAKLGESGRSFAADLERRRADAEAADRQALLRLAEQIAMLDGEIAERRAGHERQSAALAAQSDAILGRLDRFDQRIAEITEHGGEAEARVAESLDTLADKLLASRSALAGTDEKIGALTDASVRLLELLHASTRQTGEDLPRALEAGEQRLAQIERRAAELGAAVDATRQQGEQLAELVASSGSSLRAVLGEMEAIQARLGAGSDSHGATLEQLRTTLDDIEVQTLRLADTSRSELATAIEALSRSVQGAVSGIRENGAAAVSAVAAQLGSESAAAIDRAMRTTSAEIAGQLEQAAANASGVAREATIQLRDQLAKVNELAGNLERRVAHARQRAEEQVDNDFTRRVALLTESLNSNAIDIAKALSSDVSDTAWAAYLRGDRGIFTRRAVRLLDSGEAKAIAQIYEREEEFREHVRRFIHDFEAILRQVLSARDGHALGVTLLSSDMGKLYVALAQAIERLRD